MTKRRSAPRAVSQPRRRTASSNRTRAATALVKRERAVISVAFFVNLLDRHKRYPTRAEYNQLQGKRTNCKGNRSMRDAWMILLFIGGIVIGGAAGAVYHQGAARSLAQTIAVRDGEIDGLRDKAERDRKIAESWQQEVSAQLSQLQREYDALQLELAEQKQISAAQRDQIAKFLDGHESGESVDSNKASDAEPELPEPEPSEKEDGRVRGGKFAYHKLKLARMRDEVEISGEIENRSKKKYSSAYFHIDLYGKGGKPVDKFVITMFKLAPGETRSFEEHMPSDQVALHEEVRKFGVTAALLVEDQE